MATAETKKERRILKKYLTRYFTAKDRLRILHNRLGKLESEPHGYSEASEIETRIREQAQEAQRSALKIMDIIERLPADSTERTIMELRHLDFLPWREISKTVHLTETPCYEYYRRGLDALLKDPQVRATIGLPHK